MLEREHGCELSCDRVNGGLPMMRNERGFTLAELLIAGTIAAVAATGIHTALNTTFSVHRRMVRQASSLGQNTTAFALIRVAQRLEKADRFVILNAGDIQLRIPPDDYTELDDTTRYHWERFTYDGATKRLNYIKECSAPTTEVLAAEIDAVSFAYADMDELAPPGGDCFAGNEDCNFIQYQLQWNSGPPDNRTQEFRGLVASRQIADSNVAAAGADSGDQLFAAGGPPAC